MWVLTNDNRSLVNINDTTVDTVVMTDTSIVARMTGGGTATLYQGDDAPAVWDRLGGTLAATLGALYVSELSARLAETSQDMFGVPADIPQVDTDQMVQEDPEDYPED